MRIVRTPVALLGAFLVADGIILWGYGETKALSVAVASGLLYAAAGAVLVALSFKPNYRR